MNNELYLRAMEPEDLDVLYQVENDRELWNVGVTNVPYSRQALQHFIANTTYDIYTDKQVRMMACVNQQVIGICDLVDFNSSHSRAEVGIMVMEPYRHQGYATRILQQLAVYAHDVLHLHQLYAYVDVENVVSRKLFKKVGFEDNVVVKDWVYDGCRYHDCLLMQFFL